MNGELAFSRAKMPGVRDECSTESKIGLFKDIVYGQDLDVICITETWLNDTVYDHELLPSGYTIFRNDRKGRVGGGVLIATKLNLPTREIDHSVDLLECVAVEIDLNNHQTVLFINCYRPPTDKDFVIKLKSLLNIIQINKYWGTFMVGDFNYPGIHWINGSGFTSSVTSEEQCFADCIMALYLFQLVDKPTRHDNVLDLV